MTDEELARLESYARHCVIHHRACDCREYEREIEMRQLRTDLEQAHADLAAVQDQRDGYQRAIEDHCREIRRLRAYVAQVEGECDVALERERCLRVALQQIATPEPDEAPWTRWSPLEVRGVAAWAKRIAIGALHTAPAPEPEPEPGEER